MGELPIIVQRGSRDNDREEAARLLVGGRCYEWSGAGVGAAVGAGARGGGHGTARARAAGDLSSAIADRTAASGSRAAVIASTGGTPRDGPSSSRGAFSREAEERPLEFGDNVPISEEEALEVDVGAGRIVDLDGRIAGDEETEEGAFDVVDADIGAIVDPDRGVVARLSARPPSPLRDRRLEEDSNEGCQSLDKVRVSDIPGEEGTLRNRGGARSCGAVRSATRPLDERSDLTGSSIVSEEVRGETVTRDDRRNDVAVKLLPSLARGSYSRIAVFGHGVFRSSLLWLLAMSLLCIPVLGVPAPRNGDASAIPSGRDPRGDLEPGLLDVFEEDDPPTTRNELDEQELEIIRRSIVQGLGLRRIPDPSTANVSQAVYERAHREYLKRVRLSGGEEEAAKRRELRVFRATESPGNGSGLPAKDEQWGGRRGSPLFFPLEIPEERVSVDHAALRLFLEGHPSERGIAEVLVYLRNTDDDRQLIAREAIRQPRDSRWLELDSTRAASSWLEENRENLGLELEFLQDGKPVRRSFSSAVLNVFTASEASARTKRSYPEELMPLHKGRRTKCKGDNKKCCRHELTVMFKDLKGFEFIVYPKTFDAGFCKGRCPPRYNPAHHHALLQSLLWKEDRKKVPKPCCAPSKLDQLMIVYFDENDSTELKVSYWKNIQVLECACS
ncbi:hypothetical protein KM043_000876 [Ampulex compressa]|nr:hypothetical protein KM043_000876 [Ampulex compressa]